MPSKVSITPVFYLEIPPFLFATVIKGLAAADLTSSARVVVEKSFGHDLASAQALATELHHYIDEWLWNRSYIECVEINMAESFGVGVPFFIRTGKRLQVTQTEFRVVFKEPPENF